jgi:UDP-glucose 4-epimerase
MKSNSVAVTGAAGLIGSAIARRLDDLGCRVIAFDCPGAKDYVPNSQIPIIKLDICDETLQKILTNEKVEVLVHAAAHPGGKSLKEPVEDVRVNALGSMQIIDWSAKNNCRLIYLSSSIVYGHHEYDKLSEELQPSPGTIYGVAKVACENWIKIIGASYPEFNWTILRLFATYGAGHKSSLDQGIVNIMLTQLLNGDEVVVKGSLSRVRDLIYVEDLVSAIIKILESSYTNKKIINIGTGHGISISELISKISNILNKSLDNINIIEHTSTVGDPKSNVADITLLNEMIDFQPKFTIDKGLLDLITRVTGNSSTGLKN